jgi:hypothetical protein
VGASLPVRLDWVAAAGDHANSFVTAYAVDHGGRGGDKEKRGLEDRTPLRMDTELAGTR